MAFCTIDNVYKKVESRFATIKGVYKEIIERYVVDGGVYKLVWSLSAKIKAVFNGYSYKYDYTSQGGSGTSLYLYDTDASKATSLNSSTNCISKDGYYYIVTKNSKQTIYTGYGAKNILMENLALTSTSYVKSTAIYSVRGYDIMRCIKFNNDNSRFCYAFEYKTTSTAKYSIALVFWKFDSSTGQFVYEKDICFHKDNLSTASTATPEFAISDDFTTILCKVRLADNTWKAYFYKGSPENGYTLLHSIDSDDEDQIFLDDECGEYAVIGGGLYYIGGTTVTYIMGFGFAVEHLCFSYDRSAMYIGYYDYRVNTYKLNGATATLTGTYQPSDDTFCILDENSKGEALVFADSALMLVKLNKNANGAVSGRTTIKSIVGNVTAVYSSFTRFYSTEV